jgi:tyrosyl-tRNA synthetase
MAANELLTRAVSEVVPMDVATKKLEAGKPIRVYLGIDPTGSKLHLGHSVPLRKLRAFQDAGHEVIFVIGSFTAMIGDPSGRDTQREALSKEDVMKNFETYKAQAGKILDFSKIRLAYNHEWLEKLGLKDILELASHFTVQQMIQRDMFKERMKKGDDLSIMEFFYPLMVGYDSVVLDVDCELGGNDQLFNMLAGRKLQTAMGKRDKFVVTTKLIEGTDGRKMSKTYDNCIWLEDSAKDMFGKTMRIKDELILTYMECCTDIPMEEIKEAEKAMKKGTNPKEMKVKLAKAIVALYHGEDAGEKEAAAFESQFHDKQVPTDIPQVKAKKGTALLDLMVAENLAPSKSEARRLIEQGAVKLDDNVIDSIEAKVEAGTLKVGKRKFVKIYV